MRTIDTVTDQTRIEQGEKDTWIFHRHQHATPPREIFDVFANFWSLALAMDLPPNNLYLHRQGAKIELQGCLALYIPPFSILHWENRGQPFAWQALIVDGPPPAQAPQGACYVSLAPEDPVPWPLDRCWSERFVESLGKNHKLHCVEKEELISPLARQIKQEIDRRCFEDFSLEELAHSLHCARGSLSRAFRQGYGITPVEYRNFQRIFRGSLDLMKGQKVVDVGHGVGFQDLSRFNKQFKNYMNTSPRHYQLRSE